MNPEGVAQAAIDTKRKKFLRRLKARHVFITAGLGGAQLRRGRRIRRRFAREAAALTDVGRDQAI